MAAEMASLPWRKKPWTEAGGEDLVVRADGRVACEAFDAEHAEVILRAVNSHAALVAALRGALDHLEGWGVDDAGEDYPRPEVQAVIARAEAALALAEPGGPSGAG